MRKEDIKQLLVDYIKHMRDVTYANIEEFFEDHGFEYKGDRGSRSAVCRHVIFWEGWNNEAFDMISELMSEGKIHCSSTNVITYLIDGKGLDLPIVKTNRDYTTDHWLPVIFNAGAAEQ